MGRVAAVRLSSRRLIGAFCVASRRIVARAIYVGLRTWRHFATRVGCGAVRGKPRATGVRA